MSRSAEANARLNLQAKIRDEQARLGVKPVYRRGMPQATLELHLALLRNGHLISDPAALLTPVPVAKPITRVPSAPPIARNTPVPPRHITILPPAQSGEHRIDLREIAAAAAKAAVEAVMAVYENDSATELATRRVRRSA